MHRSERGHRLLKNLFGDTNWLTILLIVAGLVSLSWAADGLYQLLTEGYRPMVAWVAGASAGVLLLLVVGAKFRGEKLTQRERVWPDSDAHPAGARGLVVYLSDFGGPPDQKEERRQDVERYVRETEPGTDPAAVLDPKHPWLMPVAGIEPHALSLRRLVVVASRDSGGLEGTWRQLDLFRSFLEHRFPGLTGCIEPVGAYLGEDRPFEGDSEGGEGVPFGELQPLVEVTDKAFVRLADEFRGGGKEGRVLVDVTSGSRETGIAGTLVTLARNRRFQHVNTASKDVRTFDIEYVAESD